MALVVDCHRHVFLTEEWTEDHNFYYLFIHLAVLLY